MGDVTVYYFRRYNLRLTRIIPPSTFCIYIIITIHQTVPIAETLYVALLFYFTILCAQVLFASTDPNAGLFLLYFVQPSRLDSSLPVENSIKKELLFRVYYSIACYLLMLLSMSLCR